VVKESRIVNVDIWVGKIVEAEELKWPSTFTLTIAARETLHIKDPPLRD
jgi:hypothetical protein